MPIRVTHGEPSTYAQLGKLVGEAQREERDIERMERQISESRQMKFRQETQQLQADLAEQNAQRQVAFQFERLNRVQEHDLEMLLQRNQIVQMNQLQKEITAENERDRKLKVIAEDDRLNEEQKMRARLQVLTGVRLPVKQKSLYDQYMGGELSSLTGLAPEETVTKSFREPRRYTTPEEVGYGRWGFTPRTEPAPSGPTPEIPEPETEAEIAKLPKGSVFRAPDGTLKYR